MGGRGSQRMQLLAMMLDDLNSTPGTRMVEGEGGNLTLEFSSDLHIHAGANGLLTHIHTGEDIYKETYTKAGASAPSTINNILQLYVLHFFNKLCV